MEKELLLKIFHKYGFYSYKKEPFLYEGEEGVGILFTFKDSFYGSLSRLFIPKDENDADDFLKNYYIYKKKKKDVQIVLNDYKVLTPEITFQENSKIEELDLEEKGEMERNYIQKLKRTFALLIQIIETKLTIQNTTYHNLIQLTNEWILKQNEFMDEWSAYDNNQERIPSVKEKPLENYENEINQWKTSMKTLNDKDTLEKIIFCFVDFLKSLEIDEGFLKNKYELIRVPLEIAVVNQKMQLLKEKKKGLFGKKGDMEAAFQEIEEKSTLHNIVRYEHYKENEIQRIQEKYTVIPDLDIRTIGDYFLEFDNLKIDEPVLEEEPKKVNSSFENDMNFLESVYQARSKEEQEMLVSYFYLAKNVFSQSDPFYAVQQFINKMKNPNNIMIAIKYFKNLSLESVESCLDSISLLVEKVRKIEKTDLQGSINVFLKDNKKITSSYLKASSKRLLAPIQNVGENDCFYIASLKKGTSVLFLPEEIVEDETDEGFYLQKDCPYFLIDLEKNRISNENSDIIKVVEYTFEKHLEEKVTVVHRIVRNKVNLYKKIVVERKL